MQRKNYLLRRRSGFAVIMAIAVIVVISTIMAVSLSMTSTTTKKTTDIYLYEQAVLLSKSAAEYALLQISKNPPCSALSTSTLNFTQDSIYDINIAIQYIYDSDASCTANGGTLYTTVANEEQSGSVLMDITVSVNDTTVTSEPIRYFRRSIQKL